MTTWSRSKPTSAARDNTDPAVKEDYERMAQACIAAIADGQIVIHMSFPYFVKFTSDGFPPKTLVEQTPTTNVYKISVKKLLKWLNESGYTPHTYRGVVVARQSALLKLATIERELDSYNLQEDNSNF